MNSNYSMKSQPFYVIVNYSSNTINDVICLPTFVLVVAETRFLFLIRLPLNKNVSVNDDE